MMVDLIVEHRSRRISLRLLKETLSKVTKDQFLTDVDQDWLDVPE
jgi:hypothetical protein